MAEIAGHEPAPSYLGDAAAYVDAVVARARQHPGGDPVIPSITVVRLTGARHRAELPLLVLGPSLGTSATTLVDRLRGRA